MLATVYLIIAAVFGLTLVNLAVPDVRRLFVACAPSKDAIASIPNTLFTVPAGILLGIITTGFINYFSILGLSYVISDHSLCKRSGMIITFTAVLWLSLSNLIIINRRRLKQIKNDNFEEIPPYTYKLRDTMFYGIIIVALTAAATFLMTYTYRMSDGYLMAGVSTFSDLSPHTAMVSSFSNGFNFPTQYMHFSGDGIQYHFLFYFFAGMLNYGGLPIDIALNTLSIICMVSALVLIGLLAVLLSGKKGAFLFAPILVLFRSAWNVFDHLLLLMKDMSFSDALNSIFNYTEWYKVTDYDDWGIWAINVYPNQRHLMLGVGLLIMVVILFIPFVRRMCISMMRAGSFGGSIKAFLFSRNSWIPRKGDELGPVKITLLTCLTVILIPYFHGSALIGLLLVLFGMAIFSECRLLHLLIAVCAVASSFIQTYAFSGGASNVVSFKLYPGFILEDTGIRSITVYLLIITGLTLILGILVSLIYLIADVAKKRPVYRTLMFLCFLLPLVFAFNFKITAEVLANHKFIQITLILVDAFVAAFLANLFSIPFKIRSKKGAEAAGATVATETLTDNGESASESDVDDEAEDAVKNLADDIDDEDLDLPEEIGLPDEDELPDDVVEAIDEVVNLADMKEVTDADEDDGSEESDVETETESESESDNEIETSAEESTEESPEEGSEDNEADDDASESDIPDETESGVRPGNEIVPLTKSTDIVITESTELIDDEVITEESIPEEMEYEPEESSDDEATGGSDAEEPEEEAAVAAVKPKREGIPLISFILIQFVAIVLGLALLLGLTATGISEWCTYYNKNKDHYPIDTRAALTQWIVENTDTSDVFLTPMWSFHEFYLAGRPSYYGWPYYAWSAGHDTETRDKIYAWLISGCGGDIEEFKRYCKERGIKYLIADPEFSFGEYYEGATFNWEFFAENLPQVASFSAIGTKIYKIY